MKIKYQLLITFMLLFLGVSCSDNFLEEKKQYGLYDETFYQNEERVNWYINNMYYDFFQAYNDPNRTVVGSYTDNYSRMTEELGGIVDLINPAKVFSKSNDTFTGLLGYYGAKITTSITNNPYSRIRECNEILENIDTKGSSLSKTFRDGVKGQVLYLRALQYFDLMRVYGGVPIVTKVQLLLDTYDDIKTPRSKPSEVVKQISDDLDMAATLLPAKWDNANYGRFTRGAALAQKSRVLLTFASPLFNKDWDNSANERWEKALQAGLAAEAQLTVDGFGLFGTTAKQWQDMFATANNGFCSEAIVVQLLSTGNLSVNLNNSWERRIRPVSQSGAGSIDAPKGMIDLFPMGDGKRPTTANGYNDFTFFVNRDPRFYRTFAFSGVRWDYTETLGADKYKPVFWNYRIANAANSSFQFSDSNNDSSPAVVRKMTGVTAANTSSFQYSGNDIFEYRYAELLLNIAECYAAQGNTTKATDYLNLIRKRVGIPSANNYGIGILADKYAAIEAVLYERRVELAYEGKRYWDVQRWMLYSDDNMGGAIVNNTCAKLGLAPINGTLRRGNFLQAKTKGTSDVLATLRASVSLDIDAAPAAFATQVATLAAFYNTNFEVVPLVTPMDASVIQFNSNYYILGLNQGVLTQNTWLPQTIGWKDAINASGTFNYQE